MERAKGASLSGRKVGWCEPSMKEERWVDFSVPCLLLTKKAGKALKFPFQSVMRTS